MLYYFLLTLSTLGIDAFSVITGYWQAQTNTLKLKAIQFKFHQLVVTRLESPV